MLQRTLCVLFVVFAVGCGGGEPIAIEREAPGGVIHAKVSVGAPLEGVDAVVYAIDPVSGRPIEGRSGGPILAEAKGASAAGVLELRLSDDASWDGPIQVVVTGNSLSYTDPTSEAILTRVSLPGSFQLSSYVQRFRSGTEITVPVTLYTSLADAAVAAYAKGKNPSSTSRRPLEQAMPLVDDLLAKHLSRPATWDLRTTVPVDLTGDVGGLRDVVYAALPDLALNQMARDISVSIGQQPGTSVTAYTLLELLRKDISDGVFDGKQEGTPLTSGRSPAYELTADTTRLDLAKSLDAFVASSQNRTGLTRQGLQGFGVFDNIALDQSILYPQDENPSGFDNVPPTVSFTLSFRVADGSSVTPSEVQGAVVTGNVTVVASAEDPSGVANVRVALEDGRFLTLSSETTNTRFVGSFEVSADPDGPLRFVATAVDMLGNTGTQVLQVRVDNTKPVLNVIAPVEGTHYSGTLPVDATAVDPHVTAFSAVGLSGFVDTVAAPEVLKGQVDLASYEDGPIPVHLRACDSAKNCAEREVPVAVDNTMPTIELEEPLPDFAPAGPFVVRLRASDAGAGVSAVKALVRGGPHYTVTQDGDEWVLNLRLGAGANEVSIWVEDAAVPTNSSQGVPPPHGVQKTIIQDVSAPSVAERSVASYRHEAGAPLALNGEMPVVPGRLTLSGNKVRLDIPEEATIRKTYVTSTWGGGAPPTGAELEGDNLHNLPFRQFSVSYQDGDSPIDSVTWRIQASDDNWVTTHESSGDAIPANATQTNQLLYNVVFSRETIPLLNTTTSRTVKLRLLVKARDVAGNEFETPEAEAFHNIYELLDTPLHYVLDSSYQSEAPPSSIYRYRLSSDGYQNLFISDGAIQFPGAIARLARVRVYNPWAEDVAIQQAGSFQYELRETWLSDRKPFTTSGPRPEVVNGLVSVDGHTLRQFERYDSIPDSGLNHAPDCTATYNNTGSVCGRGWHGSKAVAHMNGSTTALVCFSDFPGSLWRRSLSASHESALYYLPGENAVAKVSGAAVVPAAAGSGPGEVVVYPGVQRSGLARESWEYPLQSLPGFEGTRYQKLMGAIYHPVGPRAVCSYGGPPPFPVTDFYVMQYELMKWAHALTASKSSITSGGLAFSARPIHAGPGGVRLTGPVPAPKALPFTLNFDH